MNAHLSDRLSTQIALEAETIILTQDISTSAARLNDIRAHTENDEDMQELIVVIRAEWPFTFTGEETQIYLLAAQPA